MSDLAAVVPGLAGAIASVNGFEIPEVGPHKEEVQMRAAGRVAPVAQVLAMGS